MVVLGAGAWGTALAVHLQRNEHIVTLVARRLEQAARLTSERENREYLPGIKLPNSLQIGHEIAPAIMEAEVVFLAAPARGIAELCHAVARASDSAWRLRAVISLAKGLEPENARLPYESMVECLPAISQGVLSGPTHAGGLGQGLPTAMVLAMGDDEVARILQEAISGPALRVYRSNDALGVSLAGVLKNIYAIALGICDGLKLGDNAKAALLSRSLNEMMRVGRFLGGRPETFLGLAGVGDLVATSYGGWSRNRTFGQQVGEGKTARMLIEEQKTVVEGFEASRLFFGRLQGAAVEAPILCEVVAVLHEGKDPAKAVQTLMTRDLCPEEVSLG